MSVSPGPRQAATSAIGTNHTTSPTASVTSVRATVGFVCSARGASSAIATRSCSSSSSTTPTRNRSGHAEPPTSPIAPATSTITGNGTCTT